MTNGTFALVALVSMRRPVNRSMLTDWWQIFLFKGWRDTDSHLLLQTTRDQCDGALSWSICSKKDLWISSSKYAFQLILYRLQKHSLHWFLRLYLEFKKLNSFRYTHVCVRGKLECQRPPLIHIYVLLLDHLSLPIPPSKRNNLGFYNRQTLD